jgi:hypothetical protein
VSQATPEALPTVKYAGLHLLWQKYNKQMVDILVKRSYNTYIDSKHWESDMGYTLITKQGKIMQFYIEAVANTYQSIYGGVVFSQQVLTMVDKVVN